MDRLHPALLLLLIVAVVAVLAWGYRILRLRSFSQVSLSEGDIDRLQAELLDYVKDQSYNQGVMVDLASFWRQRKIKREADRLAVMGLLFDKGVLLVSRRSGDLSVVIMNWLEDNILLPVPLRVCLSEREWQRMVSGARGDTIIHTLYEGDHVEGPKVGRDYTGGDKVGRDKTGRDKTGRDKTGRDSATVTESQVDASFNRDATVAITSVDQLAAELQSLAGQARTNGVAAEVVDALEWAADRAAEPAPPLSEFAQRHSVLATVGGWVGERLTAIADASTGALASNWILDLLK